MDARLSGVNVIPCFHAVGVGLLVQSEGNTIQDCEIDGNIEGNLIQLGFSVRGHHNLVTGNYIVQNIYFHHNYCERTVGLFEA